MSDMLRVSLLHTLVSHRGEANLYFTGVSQLGRNFPFGFRYRGHNSCLRRRSQSLKLSRSKSRRARTKFAVGGRGAISQKSKFEIEAALGTKESRWDSLHGCPPHDPTTLMIISLSFALCSARIFTENLKCEFRDLRPFPYCMRSNVAVLKFHPKNHRTAA